MNPCRFSFGDAHPGLGVPEKFPGFGVSFFVSCSCREAASFNQAFQGYLVPYWESPFKRRTAVLYARVGKIYLDLSAGFAELLPVPAEIQHRLTGRTIKIHTSAGPKEIKVFTPFWCHIANDGMFPEDVEPIVHLMREMTDTRSRDRFVYRFERNRPNEAVLLSRLNLRDALLQRSGVGGVSPWVRYRRVQIPCASMRATARHSGAC